MAVAIAFSAWMLWFAGLAGDAPTATVMVASYSLTAALAAVLAARAGRRARGLQARVWRLFAIGLACWAFGAIPVLGWFAAGGSPWDLPWWSQLPYLAAYPAWYRALWLMRQPVLAASRRARLETWGIELAAFTAAGMLVVAILWNDTLDLGQNLTYLLPSVLDLLLVAGLYAATRRVPITRTTAHAWLAGAFATLWLTDTMANFLIPRAHKIATGLVLLGYVIPMGLMAVAATRPMRTTETRAALGRSSVAVAVVALALVAPAGALVEGPARWLAWGIGLLVALWLLEATKRGAAAETDPLTGYLEGPPFERYLAGIISAAAPERPASLLAIDLRGLGEWTAANGAGAADALVSDVTGRLSGAEPPGGAWARLGPGRFAWLGMGEGDEAPLLAAAAAAALPDGMSAHVGIVLLPADAAGAQSALAAAEETLAAAGPAGRPTLRFDGGRLEGVTSEGAGASARRRRARIEEVMAQPGVLRPAFQPIAELAGGGVIGVEALARFDCEPRRGPDRWIAEAHEVGIGLELEAECLRRAWSRRGALPPGVGMSLNASPALLVSPVLDDALGPGSLQGCVIEVTEHAHVTDYGVLVARLAELRARGARLAVDDAGAGHSSMRHITELRPDYVKLDRSLVAGIDEDQVLQALVASIVTFAERIGAQVIAEGIERVEELRALVGAGVALGQGYLLARPQAELSDAMSVSHPRSGAVRAA
ncbi:MAG: EAL domain-containing protein [Thermoleophilia bacterium]|jgi:EAL domain-containing protein (putative c-di-GMP-specific phosphodiesterase class I)/GGDEF domain-containing protein|nr:EAL domain-containing protein [Thermoleophilia bacterium]